MTADICLHIWLAKDAFWCNFFLTQEGKPEVGCEGILSQCLICMKRKLELQCSELVTTFRIK